MPTAFTQKEIKAITNLIREWPTSEKLTWDLICEASQVVLEFKPTRQALSSKQLINNAYKTRKLEIASKKRETDNLILPKSLTAAAIQIKNLQEENRLLRAELASMAEAARAFIYNATKTMKLEELRKKPPKSDRR